MKNFVIPPGSPIYGATAEKIIKITGSNIIKNDNPVLGNFCEAILILINSGSFSE